jgi:hypothetical protein
MYDDRVSIIRETHGGHITQHSPHRLAMPHVLRSDDFDHDYVLRYWCGDWHTHTATRDGIPSDQDLQGWHRELDRLGRHAYVGLIVTADPNGPDRLDVPAHPPLGPALRRQTGRTRTGPPGRMGVNDPTQLEATDTFVLALKPPLWVRVIQRGQRLDPDGPAVQQSPSMFGPAQPFAPVTAEEVN